MVDPTGKPQSDRQRRHRELLLVASLAVGAVLGGAAAAGIAVAAFTPLASSQNPHAGSQDITISHPTTGTEIAAIAARTTASVVTISATDAAVGSGTGSGVILSPDGYVLTNTHVVTLDGVTANATISAKASDGKIYQATIVGTDPIGDLAVIKLTNANGLSPLPFGDSSRLNVGDSAIAIGAPLGLSGTVTAGIVSSLNRSITVASSAPRTATQDGSTATSAPYDFWNNLPQTQKPQTATTATISLAVIQTDAAINPGNSGGPLLDSNGRLIGINVAIASTNSGTSVASGSIGVGFSIPVNIARRVADEIIATGSATHGLLGAAVADSTNHTVVGASINAVTPGGPAEAAGLRPGDVVTAVGNIGVSSASDLTAEIRGFAAGATTSLTYSRTNASAATSVVLGTFAG